MGIKTVQDTSLTSVANAIRVKAEISGTLEFPDDFVSAIQNISTGITPTGTLSITQNGTYDVTDYASADVNVSGGGGDSVLRDLIERSTINAVIPNGTKKIGNNAFYGCQGLKTAVAPNGVASIGQNVFRNCYELETVDLPSSVTLIDAFAFGSCAKLTSLTVRSTTPPAIARNTFDGAKATANIYVPASSVGAYKSANYWSARADYIQAIPE